MIDLWMNGWESTGINLYLFESSITFRWAAIPVFAVLVFLIMGCNFIFFAFPDLIFCLFDKILRAAAEHRANDEKET